MPCGVEVSTSSTTSSTFSKIEAGRIELDPVEFLLRDATGDTLNPLALSRLHTRLFALPSHLVQQPHVLPIRRRPYRLYCRRQKPLASRLSPTPQVLASSSAVSASFSSQFLEAVILSLILPVRDVHWVARSLFDNRHTCWRLSRQSHRSGLANRGSRN